MTFNADFVFNTTITTLAFGSCHKSKYANPQVWYNIAATDPETFLWTGDAIYPPIRDVADPQTMYKEYQNMKTNTDIGYSNFLLRTKNDRMSIFGTWDGM